MPGLNQFFKKNLDKVVAEAALDTKTSEPQESSEKQEKASDVEDNFDEVSTDAEPGVQKVEAVTLVWSKPAIYATYAWIWVCFFMLAFQSAVGNNVIAYAYSDFQQAPQVATASILSTVIGGILRLPMAKTLNLWGRAEGFLVMVVIYLIGIIVIASCNGPNGYAAGYVLYWIGYDMIYMILDIFIADTTGLRNRAFAFAFASTPFICTAFTGPLAASSFLDTATWRWAYGAFAIIMPFVFVPLAVVFWFYSKKAKQLGLIPETNSGRTLAQSVYYYVKEFDVVGALLLMAGFLIFLLPFSLNQNGRADYKSAAFIAMVVVGVLIFPVFVVWEKWFAPKRFIRWELLKDPSVTGACFLAMIIYFSFYCWELYFYNFNTVVYNLTVSNAGYMSQIWNVGSCFWGVVFGVWVRLVKTYKYTCLCFGLPLMILGSGLMIHFRGQHSNIGFIVMCQIFIAFGGGTLVIGNDMAVMASANTIEGVPLMLALLGLFNSVGGAIGFAVAAAINNNTFPDTLRDALPDDVKFNATAIYFGGVSAQLEYAVGTPIRDAINHAYGISQRNGAIASTCLLVAGFPAIAIWKNYNVDKRQNKGQVL